VAGRDRVFLPARTLAQSSPRPAVGPQPSPQGECRKEIVLPQRRCTVWQGWILVTPNANVPDPAIRLAGVAGVDAVNAVDAVDDEDKGCTERVYRGLGAGLSEPGTPSHLERPNREFALHIAARIPATAGAAGD